MLLAPRVAPCVDQGGSHLIHFPDLGPRIINIGENHGRPAEDAVLECHAFVNGYIVLDLTLLSNGHIRPDDHVLADIAVFTNGRVGKHMREMPDFGTSTDIHLVVNNSGLVDEYLSCIFNPITVRHIGIACVQWKLILIVLKKK